LNRSRSFYHRYVEISLEFDKSYEDQWWLIVFQKVVFAILHQLRNNLLAGNYYIEKTFLEIVCCFDFDRTPFFAVQWSSSRRDSRSIPSWRTICQGWLLQCAVAFRSEPAATFLLVAIAAHVLRFGYQRQPTAESDGKSGMLHVAPTLPETCSVFPAPQRSSARQAIWSRTHRILFHWTEFFGIQHLLQFTHATTVRLVLPNKPRGRLLLFLWFPSFCQLRIESVRGRRYFGWLNCRLFVESTPIFMNSQLFSWADIYFYQYISIILITFILDGDAIQDVPIPATLHRQRHLSRTSPLWMTGDRFINVRLHTFFWTNADRMPHLRCIFEATSS